jgi:phage major head subunit gpT-like protein
MDITPENVRRLRTDLHREFRTAFDTAPVFYPLLTTNVPSSSKQNDYTWITAMPRMREWLGSRVVQNLGGAAYSIVNKLWEMTIGVKRDDIEDDNLGFYSTWVQQSGESARQHPDELILDLLQNGHQRVCFDGQYFFDTDHPINGADSSDGVYSNYFTGTALSVANYQAVRASTLAYKDAAGRSLGVNMNLLIVPPALEVTARTIVEVPTLTGGAGNPNYGTAKVLMLPQLAGQDTTWYLLNNTRVLKPFIFQSRRPLNFVLKNQITDEVVLIENEVRLYGDARYNVGYSLPFLAAKAVA